MTRSCGESKGVVKVIIYFLEATEMADGSISGVYQVILSRWVLSSMVMGGRFKDLLTESSEKLLFKNS